MVLGLTMITQKIEEINNIPIIIFYDRIRKYSNQLQNKYINVQTIKPVSVVLGNVPHIPMYPTFIFCNGKAHGHHHDPWSTIYQKKFASFQNSLLSKINLMC